MRNIARRLKGVAEGVRLLESQGEAGEDAYDWIEKEKQRGWSPEVAAQALARLVEEKATAFDSGSRASTPGPRLLDYRNVEILEEVRWLWEPYLPLGFLSLLEGDPDAGKSTITQAIAAAITTGRSLPELAKASEARHVLLCSTEDHPGLIKKRFEAMGGDSDFLHGTEQPVPLNREKGLDWLQRQLEEYRPALVVLDPLSAHLGARVDMHRANEVRSVLAPLSGLAEEFDCCILLVRHLNKGAGSKAIYRGQGSIDFTGAARSVLLAGVISEEQDVRAFVHIKHNLSPKGPAQGYSISEAGLRWTGQLPDLTPVDLLASDVEDSSALGEAKEFLLEELTAGPLAVSEIKSRAARAGISSKTLFRAKKALGIQSRKGGMQDGWSWSLPEASSPEEGQDGEGGSLAIFGSRWPPSGHSGENASLLRGN